MLDSRYPMLFHVFEAPGLSPELRVKARIFVARVKARVPGIHGCFNAKSESLYFYWKRLGPSGGPLCVPIVGDDAWALDQRDIDDCVTVLQLSLVPWEEREKAQKAKEAEAAKDKAQAEEKSKAERRPGIRDHASFLSRKKRGVAKVSAFVERPSGLLLPHDEGDSQ